MPTPAFEDVAPADYLTRLAASGWGQAYKQLAAAELGIRPGDTVLDLGCGPGADLPAFAAAAGPGGRVIGVDHDPAAVIRARAAAARLPRVEVRAGDIAALALPAASADRVHTDRVLQHVPDPAAVLAQARRVLRPGGTAVFAEPDWDTLVIDFPEAPVARAYRRFVTERVVRNAAVGRQLPRLAAAAGFRGIRVIPATAVFRDVRAADQVLGLRRVTARAVTAGYLTPEQAGPWLDHLATQPFFASATLFVTAAAAS
jgi:ubiquinone/menaquinone biosynthesis C-methylase UbiE